MPDPQPAHRPEVFAPHRIGRLGLFVHPKDEAAFVTDEWASIAKRLHMLGLWAGLAFLAAGVVDWHVLHRRDGFVLAALWMLRLVAFGCGAWLAWVARAASNPAPRRLRAALLLFELAVIVAWRIVTYAYGAYSPYEAISAVVMLLVFYAYAPILQRANLVVLPLSAAIFMIEAVYVQHAPARAAANLIILLGVSNLIGWPIAIQMAARKRQAWIDRRRLEMEMAERRRAETGLHMLFEACPVPLVLAGQDSGAIHQINAAARDLFGSDPEGEATGASGALQVPLGLRGLLQQFAHASAQAPVDAKLHTAQGQPIEVMLSARSLAYDGEPCVLISLVEITERKRLEHDLKRLARTDPLTGLRNRRGFFAHADLTLMKTDRSPVALLVMDVDHFKQINDHHGHALGDLVLQQLAARVRLVLRAGDILARIGGEEFAALIPVASLAEATAMAERIRLRVCNDALQHEGLRTPVSLSIGVTMVGAHEQSLDAALVRADAAMYRAKRSGRNRVEVELASGDAVH